MAFPQRVHTSCSAACKRGIRGAGGWSCRPHPCGLIVWPLKALRIPRRTDYRPTPMGSGRRRDSMPTQLQEPVTTLDERQLTAIELLSRGMKAEAVAEQIGASSRTIRRWKKDP